MNDKIIKVIKLLIFTILTIVSLSINNNHIFYFNYSFIVKSIIVFIIFYYAYFKNKNIEKKYIFISMLLSIFMIIGKNFETFGDYFQFNLKILLFDLIIFIGYFLLIYGTVNLLLSANYFKINSNNKVIQFIDKHFITISILFILICRIPYLISSFPFVSTGDTLDSICQFLKQNCSWSNNYLNINNSSVYLNNHHPFLFTIIIGLFMSIKNQTLGAFLYTLFQLLITTSIFIYLLHFMKKINTSIFIRIISLLFIAFNPVIQSYTFVAVKDVFSAIFTLLYVVFLFKIIINYNDIYNNKKNIIIFIIIMLLVILFRHNGIITIILSYPFLFIIYKKNIKTMFIVFLIPIIISASFNSFMYNMIGASKGSKRELLSLPFMQISRVVKLEGKDAFMDQDIKKIDKVISYDGIEINYSPDISDFVKNNYNENVSKKEVGELLIVWLKYFFKYPNIYLSHLLNATYKYYYPNTSLKDLYLNSNQRVITLFNLKTFWINDYFKNVVVSTNSILKNVPIISLFYNIGIYTWSLFLTIYYVIINKKSKYLIPCLPLLAVLVACVLSPVNGSIRYALPIIFSFPVYLIIIDIIKRQNLK